MSERFAPPTLADIAERTRVPAAYLSKVLQGLRVKGIVRLQRGIGGGVRLACAPEELTILDVVNAVDPIQRIDSCPLDLKTHGTHLCALHRRMDNAIRSMEDAFRETTLAELLADPKVKKLIAELYNAIDEHVPEAELASIGIDVKVIAVVPPAGRAGDAQFSSGASPGEASLETTWISAVPRSARLARYMA